ncbi:MAG: hypothetical protein FWH48_01060 [Oscillospiraceae bacterium]|nr:hypothetical protein [Oscillospiraceae bacterium]
MKKAKNVINIAIVISLCFVLLATIGPTKETVREPEEAWKNPEFQIKNTISSLLQSCFIAQIIESIIDKYGIVDRFGKYYPPDYAGAFINENGTLVVCLTTLDSVDKYRQYYSLAKEKMLEESDSHFTGLSIEISDYVTYELRKYSFAYLAMLQEILFEKMEDLSITATELDEDENVIRIGLKNFDDKEAVDDYLRKSEIDLQAVKYYKYVGTNKFFG